MPSSLWDLQALDDVKIVALFTNTSCKLSEHSKYYSLHCSMLNRFSNYTRRIFELTEVFMTSEYGKNMSLCLCNRYCMVGSALWIIKPATPRA